MSSRLPLARYRRWMPLLGLTLGAALLAIPVAKHRAGATAGTTNPHVPWANNTSQSGINVAPTSVRPTPVARDAAPRHRVAARPRPRRQTPTATKVRVTRVRRPATAKLASAPTAKSARRSVDAYRGLGSWVDIYDPRAFARPAAAIRNMAAHGVRTLYVETSNSDQSLPIMHPAQLRILIREAHAHKMRIVAWYLPRFTSVSHDAARIEKAIHFHTADGQRFDSFALDIESTDVGNVAARNRAVQQLSAKVRRMAGPSYPLGAIIPSPLDIKHGFWGNPFPYRALARTYDAFLPMSYYTFRVHGAGPTRARTIADVRLIRAQPGCSRVPIHMIGGLANKSNPAEVRALASGVRASRSIGGSLYTWSGTSPAEWRQLRSLSSLK